MDAGMGFRLEVCALVTGKLAGPASAEEVFRELRRVSSRDWPIVLDYAGIKVTHAHLLELGRRIGSHFGRLDAALRQVSEIRFANGMHPIQGANALVALGATQAHRLLDAQRCRRHWFGSPLRRLILRLFGKRRFRRLFGNPPKPEVPT
jgi:hypothetical protein